MEWTSRRNGRDGDETGFEKSRQDYFIPLQRSNDEIQMIAMRYYTSRYYKSGTFGIDAVEKKSSSNSCGMS